MIAFKQFKVGLCVVHTEGDVVSSTKYILLLSRCRRNTLKFKTVNACSVVLKVAFLRFALLCLGIIFQPLVNNDVSITFGIKYK